MFKFTIDIIMDSNAHLRAKDLVEILERDEMNNLHVEPVVDSTSGLITGLFIKQKTEV